MVLPRGVVAGAPRIEIDFSSNDEVHGVGDLAVANDDLAWLEVFDCEMEADDLEVGPQLPESFDPERRGALSVGGCLSHAGAEYTV
mmetsp:Transcript_13795/g.40388  ORF Transcript_13795/g.40388 Transcript_13795/m.40388 type:complete len:86 (+) Transcript_13795:848-1105(+)